VDFFDPMLRGGATLSTTGLADSLTGGTLTFFVGGAAQTVTVAPSTDTFESVMRQITGMIDSALGGAGAGYGPGLPNETTWSLDPASGRLSITYVPAAGEQITFGAASDTTNFLQLAGLQGAPAPTSGATRTITGLAPVALVRAAHLRLDQTIAMDLEAIAAASGVISAAGATNLDVSTGLPSTGLRADAGMQLGTYRLAITPAAGGTAQVTLYRMNGAQVGASETVTVTVPTGGNTVEVHFATLGARITANANLGSVPIAAGPASQFTYSGPSSGPGSNGNALFLADLQRRRIAALGDATPDDYYASIVAQLGVQTRQAEQISENQQLLADHLAKRRESFSGVSLDEEAVNLIRYQRAYQAAARGITAVVEMLVTIIGRMGGVGN
jgi:flagellar hook-associated protein FlgK